jgi:hypothetical protein
MMKMALKPSLEGDITKVDGYYLAVARNPETGEFIGFYGFTPDETYIRGAGTWITASGPALNKLNGAQLVEMKDSFIFRFDALDKKNQLPPSDEVLEEKSTRGRPGSWYNQKM